MMKKRGSRTWQWLDLPPDVLGKLPRIEWIGTERLYVENHLGISRFSPQEVVFRTKDGLIQILGEQMTMKALHPDFAVLEGTIDKISFDKRG
jgi:sporulation protein YqfC